MADRIRVLHVDDDADFLDLAATYLEREHGGFAVRTATDPDAALASLETDRVDAVVSDHDMPGMDGVEFFEAVRERHPELPFILFTGKGSEEIASRAISAGVTDYLQKTGGADQYTVLANRIENAVERARSRVSYREVFQKANIGLTIRDIETGELLDVNRRYCDLLGYPREEALDLDLADITADVPGYSPERARELMRQGMEDGEITFEWPDETKSGEVVWVEVSLKTARIEGRDRMLVTVRALDDGRDREQTLKTLHAAAAEIQTCESVEAACERTVAAAERILEFGMCSVLVHEDGYLVPKAISAGAPPDGARRMAADQGLAGKTFQTGESYVTEDVGDDPDTDPAKEAYRSGISVPIGDHGVFQAVAEAPGAFDDTDVELAELLVAHTARTLDRLEFERELRDRQGALERQNKRLEEFASVVSHDLRNPLNVAQGRLELAGTTDDPDLAAVGDALDRMEELVESLLTLARQGREVEETTPTELEPLCRTCWGTVATGPAELGIETDRTLVADPNRLRQLFENLFRNAIEHAGRNVTVTVGELEDGTGFYVADDGPGIDPEDRDRVFDPGYSSTPNGTGFGLGIVREVAEAHGWKVHVTDSAAGGARFEFAGVEWAEGTTET